MQSKPSLFFTNAAFIAAAMFADSSIAAESPSLAVYAGARDRGSFSDVATGATRQIKSSASLAASLNLPLDENRQLQVLFSYQDSRVALGPPAISTSPPGVNELPMRVMYLHIGGPVFFGDGTDRGPYAVGGLGATLFDPSSSGYSSELRASANLGVGYQQPIGKRLALRFEARGYFTLVNSSGALFCSSGCAFAVRGDVVVQGELSVGLAFGL